MFWKKKIKKLENLLQLKEAERRMEHVKCCEARKQLAEVLNENAQLKRRMDFLGSEEHEYYLDALEQEKKNEVLKAEITRRARLYQHGKERMAQELRELRQAVAELRQAVADKVNNINALNINIEQGNRDYISLALGYRELCGKVEVYERFLGKIEGENNDDGIQLSRGKVSDKAGRADADADSAEAAEKQEVYGSTSAEQREEAETGGIPENGAAAGGRV